MAGSSKYKNNWQKENCDRINLTVPKGHKAQIQAHADGQGESITSFINRAISEAIESDLDHDSLEQQLQEIAARDNMSIETALMRLKITYALAVLEPYIPGITRLYNSRAALDNKQ